jgi:putative aminopeptidase FrvX
MDLLKQLYTISSKSGNEGAMKTFILKCLECVSLSIKTDRIGNLYITKGNAEKYPCVAAHLDEIHSPCKREVVIEGDKIFTVDKLWNRVGCGADDKNGLWIIINLLHSEPVLKVALFVQEERTGDIAGCRGARACDLSFFSDVKFVLECDRKGRSDVVSIGKDDTLLCDSDFIPQYLLSKYGYEMVKGGKTDVVELKMRGLEIPVCNIACGYYDAHKNSEYTMLSELQNCLSFVRDILQSV